MAAPTITTTGFADALADLSITYSYTSSGTGASVTINLKRDGVTIPAITDSTVDGLHTIASPGPGAYELVSLVITDSEGSGSDTTSYTATILGGEEGSNQFAEPISTVSAGTFSTAPLHEKIDEATPDDADSITAAAATQAVFKLDSIVDPGVDTGHKIAVRASGSGTLQTNLYQGDPTTFVQGAPWVLSRRWNRQPARLVDVDWRHPLSQGLIASCTFGAGTNGHPVELVRKKPSTTRGLPVATPSGISSAGSTTTSRGFNASLTTNSEWSAWNPSNSYTLVTAGHMIPGGSGTQMLAGAYVSTGYGWYFKIGGKLTTEVYFAMAQRWRGTTGTSIVPCHSNEYMVLAATWANGGDNNCDFVGYKNGIQVDSQTALRTDPSGASSGVPSLYFGYCLAAGAARLLQNVCHVYQGVKSSDFIRAISENPYQIYVPDQRLISPATEQTPLASFEDTLTAELQTFQHELNSVQAAGITDYTNLHARLKLT